jgi:hypothetical protein
MGNMAGTLLVGQDANDKSTAIDSMEALIANSDERDFSRARQLFRLLVRSMREGTLVDLLGTSPERLVASHAIAMTLRFSPFYMTHNFGMALRFAGMVPRDLSKTGF